MKCFQIDQNSITTGLNVVSSPYPHIGVGEEGRGRKYVRFPVAKSLAESLGYQKPCPDQNNSFWWTLDANKCPQCGAALEVKEKSKYHPQAGAVTRYYDVTRASIIKTAKGTLLMVEERDSADKRAIVLVDIPAGYRGGTTWSDSKWEMIPCPERGRRIWSCDVANGCCEKCGSECPKATEGDGYSHPDSGTVKNWLPFPSPGITVLAGGEKAQGDAGRMGGHAVRLLIMDPGSSFLVKRTGRLYGSPASRYVIWDGENLRIGTHDEIWVPEESEGVLI